MKLRAHCRGRALALRRTAMFVEEASEVICHSAVVKCWAFKSDRYTSRNIQLLMELARSPRGVYKHSTPGGVAARMFKPRCALTAVDAQAIGLVRGSS